MEIDPAKGPWITAVEALIKTPEIMRKVAKCIHEDETVFQVLTSFVKRLENDAVDKNITE